MAAARSSRSAGWCAPSSASILLPHRAQHLARALVTSRSGGESRRIPLVSSVEQRTFDYTLFDVEHTPLEPVIDRPVREAHSSRRSRNDRASERQGVGVLRLRDATTRRCDALSVRFGLLGIQCYTVYSSNRNKLGLFKRPSWHPGIRPQEADGVWGIQMALDWWLGRRLGSKSERSAARAPHAPARVSRRTPREAPQGIGAVAPPRCVARDGAPRRCVERPASFPSAPVKSRSPPVHESLSVNPQPYDPTDLAAPRSKRRSAAPYAFLRQLLPSYVER